MVFRWIVGGAMSYAVLRSIYRHYWRPISVSKLLSDSQSKNLNPLTVAITKYLKQKSYSFQYAGNQQSNLESSATFIIRYNQALFFTYRLLFRKYQRYLENLLQNPIEEELRHAIRLNKKHLKYATPYRLNMTLREFYSGWKITLTIQPHMKSERSQVKLEELANPERNFIIFTDVAEFVICCQDKHRPTYPYYNKTIGYRFVDQEEIYRMLQSKEIKEIWEVWNNSPFINATREIETGEGVVRLETSRAEGQHKRIKLVLVEGHEYYPMMIVDV